ncbi:hypothetical protein [Mariniphaga sp.]|uniref:hypothetical protein n=1 Tax=Mariniphaga sp. TaxID=1954475 RepID=UPI003562B540
MKQYIIEYGLKLLLLLLPFGAFSQWENGQIAVNFSLPEVALVDIEPDVNNRIHFTLSPASQSGRPPELAESTNETLWINYSSSLPGHQNSRSITAQISQGTIPQGISLYLEAGSYSGNGRGKPGQPAGKIELSSQPRPVISGIGNCFTGDGIANGHKLVFSIEISDYTNLATAGDTNFILLYTLTDN